MVLAQLRESSVSMEALVLISIIHERSNLCPFFGELLVKVKKLIILLICPCFHSSLGDLMILLLDFHIDGPSVLGKNGNDKLCLHFLL